MTERAPLVVPADLMQIPFGNDCIIRVDSPEPHRCGGIDMPPARGERCTSGCKTRDHESYHECLRAKNTTTYLAAPSRGLDGTTQKKWDAELDRYRHVRKLGIQPDGTKMSKVIEAERLSDERGAAYGRDFSKATPFETE